MSEIIVLDGCYYKRLGTDLQQIHVVGEEHKAKSCFSDNEPLEFKITSEHLADPIVKGTRAQRRKRERKNK